jgi:V/A-type H+-transporting ATPase subunit A
MEQKYMETQGRVIRVAGPLIVAKGIPNIKMADVVKVGKLRLIGEIIELKGDESYIQVYEETAGVGPGDPIETTGAPLSVSLGPGMLTSIYDGIQRPLNLIEEKSGVFMDRGIEVPAVDPEREWDFKPIAKVGDKVQTGDFLGEVQESSLIVHKIMVPHGIKGTVKEIKSGNLKASATVAKIDDHEVSMIQKWPVRKRRPFAKKLPVTHPVTTGQRVIDSLFTVAKGGTAAIPGPFGSGKTVVQHQIAKWADVDIIIFVGCGERGNEMTDVLLEFPKLIDPKTNKPLIERTVLIANTSNMPIAAREASVYTGSAIAEYYRDMGYSVALMADSTSRWAEALREMSGRLEEMPGEEGYPAYLGSRIAEFYERAGKGICVGSDDSRIGTLTIIGSVSPPGGDLSEPVVQNTLRVVKVFWGLDYKLAHQRHFPAINWLVSYSLYLGNLEPSFKEDVDASWSKVRDDILRLLQEEAELEEIVRLVGQDALSNREKLILFVTKSIREDYLYQSAFDAVDQFSTFEKQYKMMNFFSEFYHQSLKMIEGGVDFAQITKIKSFEKVAKMRFIPNDESEKIDAIHKEVLSELNLLRGREE